MGNDEAELALDTLRRGVENNPGNAEMRLVLARILAQQNDIDGSLEQVDTVLESDAANMEALKLKSELLVRKGDAAGLEAVARAMQEADPDSEVGFIQEAQALAAQENFDGAIDLLEKVLERNPDSVPALRAKSGMLEAQKKYPEAIAIAEKLQRLVPESGDGWVRKGRLLAKQGDKAGAIEQYAIALQKAPHSADVLKTLIGLELSEKRYDEAQARLQSILNDNPEHPSANDLLGVVYMLQKDFAAAEAAFERQIELRPDDPAGYVRLGQFHIARDDLAAATRDYERGLEVLPGNPGLMIGLAGIRERQDDFESAIGIYEKVLKEHPDNAISTNNLAMLLADHRTDEDSARRAAELSALLEKTQVPAFLDTAGWVYYRQGNYEKAAEILAGLVERAPNVQVFRYHLGMAYLKLGDKAAAREQLLKATEGEASYEGVEEARQALKSL
jgi:tetratricopeptide (TPR) repeat protein